MRAKFERWYPLGISTAIACIVVKIHVYDAYPIPSLNKEVLAATINISTITIGFLSATQSILLALENKQIIKDLKSSGTYVKLTSYLMDAITWSFMLAIVSMLGLFFETKDILSFYIFCYYITWLVVLSITGLSCYRVVRLFNKILTL